MYEERCLLTEPSSASRGSWRCARIHAHSSPPLGSARGVWAFAVARSAVAATRAAEPPAAGRGSGGSFGGSLGAPAASSLGCSAVRAACAAEGAGGHALGVGGEQHLHDLEEVFDPALAGRVQRRVAVCVFPSPKRPHVKEQKTTKKHGQQC